MDFAAIKQRIAGVPYILPEMAQDLYAFIRRARPENCLELGFGHGASSCYMAAALAANGSGRLTAVDLESAREWQQPAIEELLGTTGLASIVRVRREPTSYTWFLKKEIEAASSGGVCTPCYDFCFVDGAKNWTIDTAAFFLIDKLLKPGGWIVFDDLQWTYRSKLAEGKRKTDGVYMTGMSDDELDQPHVELIYSLLVMQHPDYANFTIKDDWWAWAQKAEGHRDVRFDYSEAYLLRRAEQERKTGVKKRLPFTPFTGSDLVF
jgi:predicted O-methyltransferase YrrM